MEINRNQSSYCEEALFKMFKCLLTIFSVCSPSCAILSSEREGRIFGGTVVLAANLNRASIASVRLNTAQGNVHVCLNFQ